LTTKSLPNFEQNKPTSNHRLLALLISDHARVLGALAKKFPNQKGLRAIAL
jgi:hypothetical protein